MASLVSGRRTPSAQPSSKPGLPMPVPSQCGPSEQQQRAQYFNSITRAHSALAALKQDHVERLNSEAASAREVRTCRCALTLSARQVASVGAPSVPGTCAAAARLCWESEVQVRDALSLEQLADEGVTVTVQHALSLIHRVEELQRRCNVKSVPLEWLPVWLGVLKAELDPIEDAELLSLIAAAFDCKDSLNSCFTRVRARWIPRSKPLGSQRTPST